MSDLSPALGGEQDDNSPCLGGKSVVWMDTVDKFIIDERDKSDAVLARAERASPGNPFVASCRAQFSASGYLSAKQIDALNRVTPYRRRRSMSWYGSDYNSHDDYANSNAFDWAGGD